MKNKSFRHSRLCNAVSAILALSVSALCMNATLADTLEGNSGTETPVASCGYNLPAPAVKADTHGLRAIFYQDYQVPVTNCYEPDTFIVWDFGDGSVYRSPSFTLAVPEIDHVYEDDGDYTVRVYFEKADGETASETKEINISLKDVDPVVHIKQHKEDMSHMEVMAGDKIRLDGSTSLSKKGHEIVSYLWSTGETTPEIEITVDDDMLNNPEKRRFSLTVTDETGASQTRTIMVETGFGEACGVPPTYTIWTHFSALNAGETVNFSDASTDDLGGLCPYNIDSGKPIDYDFVYGSFSGTEFFWDFGDGSTLSADDTNAEHTYENPGDYTVLYAVVFKDARIHTAAKMITVAEPKLKAEIVPDGRDFYFSSDSAKIFVESNEPLMLQAQVKVSDESDDSLTYKWSTGETTPSITITPAYEPQEYTIEVTDSQGNTATATVHVVRNDPVVCSVDPFSGIVPEFESVTEELTVQLKDTTTMMKVQGCGGPVYEELDEEASNITRSWDFGDGTTGEGKEVTHTYEKSGIYTVTLIVTENDESATQIARDITVVKKGDPVPVTVKNAYFSIEQGTTLELDSSLYFPPIEGATYRWSTGESTPAIVVNPVYYKEYTLDVLDSTGAVVNHLICAVEVTHPVIPEDVSEFIPSIELRTSADTQDRTVLSGTSVTIDASKSFARSNSGENREGTQLIYNWSNGKTSPVITEVITENTTLTVEVTDPATGLSNTGYVSIKAVPDEAQVPLVPCVGIEGGEIIKINANVVFTGSCNHRDPSKLIFTWTVDGEVVGNEMNLNHTFTQPGTHKVEFSVSTGFGNSASIEVDVLVVEDENTPTVAIVGNNLALIGEEVMLIAKMSSVDESDIIWTLDGEVVSGLHSSALLHVFRDVGRHNVTVEVTDKNGVKHTAQYTVNVNSVTDPIRFNYADGNESEDEGNDVPFVQSGSQDENPIKLETGRRMAINIANISGTATIHVLKVDRENNTTQACRISENFVVECAASENSNAISVDNGSDVSMQFNEDGQYQVYVSAQSANADEVTGYIPLNVVENINEEEDNEEDDDQEEVADDNHDSEDNSSEGQSSGGKKGGSLDLFSLMLLAGSSFFLRRRKK